MRLSKYSKCRGQFEALEAKQLFAADLVGGAAADLADTAVVAGYDPGDNTDIDLVAENVRTNLGGLKTNQESVAAAGIDQSGLAFESLGGQEGEPVNEYMTTDTGEPLHTAAHEAAHVIHQLGGQEGEDVARQLTGNLTKGAPWAEHNIGTTIGGQEGEPIVDPDDCPELVDHVFQEYARDDFQVTDQHYFAVR